MIPRRGSSAPPVGLLIAPRWHTGALVALFVGVTGWGLITALEWAWRSDGRGAAMLPETATERIIWVAVSLTVAWCEEFVFRGYLQRQFEALFRSATLAVALQ